MERSLNYSYNLVERTPEGVKDSTILLINQLEERFKAEPDFVALPDRRLAGSLSVLAEHLEVEPEILSSEAISGSNYMDSKDYKLELNSYNRSRALYLSTVKLQGSTLGQLSSQLVPKQEQPKEEKIQEKPSKKEESTTPPREIPQPVETVYTRDQLEDLAMVELKQILRDRGLPQTGDKQTLIDRILPPPTEETLEEPSEPLYTEESLKAMKVTDLKDILRGLGLKISGLKAELIQRILEHFRATMVTSPEVKSKPLVREEDIPIVQQPSPRKAVTPQPAQQPSPRKAVTPQPKTPPQSKEIIYTSEYLSSLKVTDLKDILRGLGLKISGLKAELVERILEASPKKEEKQEEETKTEGPSQEDLVKFGIEGPLMQLDDLPDSDTLVFSSDKEDLAPGDLRGENVEDPGNYADLAMYEDWRKKLDNSWQAEFTAPDGETWTSVSDYYKVNYNVTPSGEQYDLMKNLLLSKFSQDDELFELLLDTGDAALFHSPEDGSYYRAIVLEDVRKELRDEQEEQLEEFSEEEQ